MKECRLKSKIAQMKKDINKIDEYEKARNDLMKFLRVNNIEYFKYKRQLVIEKIL